MQNRVDVLAHQGGDTVQMLKTKEYLEKLGCQVEIDPAYDKDLRGFDLVHLFNITQVHETYLQFANARRQNKPVVLSPIYQNFTELDKKAAAGFKRLLWNLLSKDAREGVKTAVRALKNRHLVKPALKQLMLGFSRQQQEVLKRATLLLPNSEMEAKAIKQDFHLDFDYAIVPNAIDLMFARRDDSFTKKTGLKDYVLCVGNYIERKNQLGLIKAMRGLNIPLVLVGSVVPTHHNYYRAIQIEASLADFPVKIFEHVTQPELVSYYSGATVVALPSWIETTGLAGLEGGLAGCSVVITDRGYTKEYFSNLAFYCSPDDIQSIRQAVCQAYNSPKNPALADHIRRNYTWEKTAKATYEAYQNALGGAKSKN